MKNYQEKQLEIIAKIESQIESCNGKFSVVTPVADFENDERICLTSVHLPSDDFKNRIQKLIKPLKEKYPEHYYYKPESTHITIKNIRVINDPPHFNDKDIETAKKIFSEVIPKHHKFNAYYFRFMLFQNNLALVGTTDEEYGRIILDLDGEMNKKGIKDDKTYVDTNVFFSNITLARFTKPVDPEFKKMVRKMSDSIEFDPYEIDSVSLITANAALKKLNVIETWGLRGKDR